MCCCPNCQPLDEETCSDIAEEKEKPVEVVFIFYVLQWKNGFIAIAIKCASAINFMVYKRTKLCECI